MIRIVTAANSEYFTRLLALLGSIQRNHAQGEYSVAVYNIGMSEKEIQAIKKVPSVSIHEVEKKNPDILTLFKKHETRDDRMVPGLYTWKPVAVKQEIDKYDQVLWLDAGVTVSKNLSPLWEHTKNTGYFFLGCGSIEWQTPINVAERLIGHPEYLRKQALNSSTMGISRSIYNNFVLPSYGCAADIELFRDNGTASGGPDSGRHDQTIFSIIAVNSGLHVHKTGLSLELITDNGPETYSIVAERDQVSDNTLIFQSRGFADWNGDFTFMRKYLSL